MGLNSVPTHGRTLDYAAGVYDIFEPLLMLGREKDINDELIELLELENSHRVLDLGCDYDA